MSTLDPNYMTCDHTAPPIYLHGFEGAVTGTKGTYIMERFGGSGPDMPTYKHSSDELGERPWCFEEAFESARDFVLSRPSSVLIGSSFGGAITLALLQRGLWRGPVVFLAPACERYGFHLYLPSGCHAVVIHDPKDEVVDYQGSARLMEANPQQVELWQSDGGHKLHSIVKSGLLERAVNEQLARAQLLRREAI